MPRGYWSPEPVTVESFWDRVERAGPDECWPWKLSRNPKGYGFASVPGKPQQQMLAHRLAWMLAHGINPGKRQVRHTCDNPPCCNPAHLRVGRPAQNTADMMQRGRNGWLKRTHCKHGHEFAVHARMVTRKDGKRYRRCMACRREGGL